MRTPWRSYEGIISSVLDVVRKILVTFLAHPCQFAKRTNGHYARCSTGWMSAILEETNEV